MDKILSVINFLIRGVQMLAGGYATFKLGYYAIGFMTKNTRKVEEAQDGMKNVGIGLLVALSCEQIIQWLQTA